MKPADRKKQLIAEGRIYRAEVMIAKEAVRVGLQPETLARNAVARLAVIAFSAFQKRSGIVPAGLNVPSLLPLLVSGLSLVAKRKSLWKGALVAGVVAGAVVLMKKEKQAVPEQQDIDTTG